MTPLRQAALVIATLFATFTLALAAPPAQAQETSIEEATAAAFKAGNSKAISALLAPTVDVTIEDDGDTYSPAQAEAVLKKFFADHVPVNFEFKHKGTAKAGTYFIGLYQSNKRSYEVSVFTRKIEGRTLITVIKIQ